MRGIPSQLADDDLAWIKLMIRDLQAKRPRFVHADIARGLRHALQAKWGDPVDSPRAMRVSLALMDEAAAAQSRRVAKELRLQFSGGCVEEALARLHIAGGGSVRSRTKEGGYIEQFVMFADATPKEALKMYNRQRRQRDRSTRVLTVMEIGIRCCRRFPEAKTVREACQMAGVQIDHFEEVG